MGHPASGARRATSCSETGWTTPCAARRRRWTAAPPPSCSARGATRTPSRTTISPARAPGSASPAGRRSPGLGRQPDLPERRLGAAARRSPPATPGASRFLENRADSAAIGFRLDHAERQRAAGQHRHRRPGRRRSPRSTAATTRIEANVLLGGRVGIMVGGTGRGGAPSRGHRIDDNVVGGVEQGIVLQGTTGQPGAGQRVRRGGGRAGDRRTRATAPRSPATCSCGPAAGSSTRRTWPPGGNYWATADAAAASARVRGRISVLPWRPASAAGYYAKISCATALRSRRLNGFRAGRTPPSHGGFGQLAVARHAQHQPPRRLGTLRRQRVHEQLGGAGGHRVGDDQIELPLLQHPQPLLPRPHRLDHVPLRREQRAHQPMHRRDRHPPPGCGGRRP